MFQIVPGNIIKFEYANRYGNVRLRRAVFVALEFGSINHKPPEWFMRTRDLDNNNAPRSFLLSRIDGRTLGFTI